MKQFVELVSGIWTVDSLELAKAFTVPQDSVCTRQSEATLVDWRRLVFAAVLAQMGVSSDQVWERLNVLRNILHKMDKSTLTGVCLPTSAVRNMIFKEESKSVGQTVLFALKSDMN